MRIVIGLKKSNLIFILILLLILFSKPGYSQISQSSTPWGFTYSSILSEIPITEIPKPNSFKILSEDKQAEKDGTFYRYGKLLPVNINLNDGSWTRLGNGDKIWTCRIRCKESQALSLHFKDFHIPPGGKLYIYTLDKKQLLGAYTEINNNNSGIFATQLILSEELIIEYNENSNPYGNVSFTISHLGYAYRGIFKNVNSNNKAFGDSESCEVNINCSPEGDNWQNQKRGAVRVSLISGGNMGWCSGSLINNTSNDCTPYILTADHCGGDATTAEYLQWVFYFNYESPECSNPSSEGTLASETMSGCEIVAQGGQGGTAGSDFQLVECINSIPETYNTYYNGWNREDIGATSGVSIHHPAGDIKKISTFTTTLTNDDWNGSGYDSHWNVVWAATTNGHGVTEGGSSGSPIFDSNGLIVGDLTGGSSYCSTPTSPDMYGKLSYSWESNGTLPEEQLKPWLDPLNTGVLTHQGINFCSSTGLYADFTWTPTLGVIGMPVNYTDISLGNISTWFWEFQNGNPATSNDQNPSNIIYSQAGVYNVTLTISNGTTNEVKIHQINIIPPSPPTADFIASETLIYEGDTINFIDLSTGGPTSWEWTFIGGDPNSSSTQNPTNIIYNTPGIFNVSLTVLNPYGNDFITKSNYIEVLQGIPVVEICDTLSNMENFDSLMAVDMQPWGLLPGHNPLYITEYADLHANSNYDYINGLIVPIHTSVSSMNSAKVQFKVWDYDGIPGDVLGHKDVYLSDLTQNTYQMVMFDNDILLSGSFFVGYGITYYVADDYSGPHNFAIHMAKDRGLNGDNTLYVNYNSSWFEASDFALLNNIHSSLGIEPIVCSYDDIDQISIDNQHITIYPNPTSGTINITIKSDKDLSPNIYLFNSYGQFITDFNISKDLNRIKLDLKDLKNGIYFLNIIIDDDIIVKKISVIK